MSQPPDTPSARDRLFAEALSQVVDFRFDEQVAAVFPDMIHRSVPGYATLVHLIGVLAAQHVRADTCIYDLGCSLGAATLSMARQVELPGVRFVAVDRSPAMIARARELLAELGGRVTLVEADIAALDLEPCSVVVLNYTLQFIPPESRAGLLRRIHEALVPGGVLLLSEKLAFGDSAEAAAMEQAHRAFKQAQGYSELEISQKRKALERVLVPETLETHQRRLREAGFAEVLPWFRCLNFASLLARKA